MEAIRLLKEVTRAQGTDQKKLISQISEEQKSNPLLLNLLKMADRAGMTVTVDGEWVWCLLSCCFQPQLV